INFPLLEAEQKKIVFLLNRIFYWMRYVCNHKKFQERTRVHKNNVQQNIRSCLNYLIAHFNQHSRLLILRIDLHFLQKCIHKATAEDNRKALDKFLRALREGRIVESVVAYISVTEYGYHRGFHQHVLIALNSNEHQRGIYWARVIGEYWQQCTNGQGSYFDCFALKEKYRHCGIGMIHISETEKLQGLRNAVLYMLKGDYYVKIAAKNERILRKGIMPIPKNKRGAPRQKPEDTLNMEKVLRGKSLHNKP
ncbi:YagK/YfjJ domain-containing protein, partial [Chromobacterium phragmitis]